MIVTASNITQRSSSHFHISDPYKYCRELDLVIGIAKSKGYILPTDYQLSILNKTINELKSNNIWINYDVGYIFGINSLRSSSLKSTLDTGQFPTGREIPRDTIESFCRINLINPLQFESYLTKDSTRPNMPFYTSKGYKTGIIGTGFGIVNTTWNPHSSGIKWTQNNAGASVYCSNYDEDIGSNRSICGGRDTTNVRAALRMIPYTSTANIQGNINSTSGTLATYSAGGATSTKGFHRLERTASNLSTWYKNGISVGTSTQPSQSMIGTQPIYCVGDNVNGTPATGVGNPVGHFFAGAALGASLAKIEYEIFKEMRARLGYD